MEGKNVILKKSTVFLTFEFSSASSHWGSRGIMVRAMVSVVSSNCVVARVLRRVIFPRLLQLIQL